MLEAAAVGKTEGVHRSHEPFSSRSTVLVNDDSIIPFVLGIKWQQLIRSKYKKRVLAIPRPLCIIKIVRLIVGMTNKGNGLRNRNVHAPG